jgi:hypothetical protein
MIDLRDAISVLKKKREQGDTETKMGLVSKLFKGLVGYYVPRTIVLFRYIGSGYLIVELPMTEKEIFDQMAKNSLILTKNTIVGVSKENIEEIVIE